MVVLAGEHAVKKVAQEGQQGYVMDQADGNAEEGAVSASVSHFSVRAVLLTDIQLYGDGEEVEEAEDA